MLYKNYALWVCIEMGLGCGRSQLTNAHASVPSLVFHDVALALWSQDEVPITTLTPNIRVAGVNGSASRFMSFGLGTGIAKNCWINRSATKIFKSKIIFSRSRLRFLIDAKTLGKWLHGSKLTMALTNISNKYNIS